MQWIKAHVMVDADDPQTATELVAELFFELDVQGVELNDLDVAPAADRGRDACRNSQSFGVTGYFPDTPSAAERCMLLEAHLQALRHRHGGRYRISYQQMDETDWSEAWKQFFWPQRVDDHLVIKPTWREFKAEKEDLVLEIDPGMAFGTGTHPTTVLCLRLIGKYLQPHDRFLDIGTGSGILMVAAARMGAKLVHGVDNDEVAVAVAQKNMNLNQIDPKMVSLYCSDLTRSIVAQYEMVSANILSEVILLLSDDVPRVLAPEGLFICSGIIEKNKQTVLAKLASVGFTILEVAEQENWVAIAARIRG